MSVVIHLLVLLLLFFCRLQLSGGEPLLPRYVHSAALPIVTSGKRLCQRLSTYSAPTADTQITKQQTIDCGNSNGSTSSTAPGVPRPDYWRRVSACSTGDAVAKLAFDSGVHLRWWLSSSSPSLETIKCTSTALADRRRKARPLTTSLYLYVYLYPHVIYTQLCVFVAPIYL